jgi:hypothetical protein
VNVGAGARCCTGVYNVIAPSLVGALGKRRSTRWTQAGPDSSPPYLPTFCVAPGLTQACSPSLSHAPLIMTAIGPLSPACCKSKLCGPVFDYALNLAAGPA